MLKKHADGVVVVDAADGVGEEGGDGDGLVAQWTSRIGEFSFPGGEGVADLVGRAWPAFERIAMTHAGEAVAVVAHGGTNRAILCRALGLPFDRLLAFGQDYAALSILELRDGRWSLRRLNEPSG